MGLYAKACAGCGCAGHGCAGHGCAGHGRAGNGRAGYGRAGYGRAANGRGFPWNDAAAKPSVALFARGRSSIESIVQPARKGL